MFWKDDTNYEKNFNNFRLCSHILSSIFLSFLFNTAIKALAVEGMYKYDINSDWKIDVGEDIKNYTTSLNNATESSKYDLNGDTVVDFFDIVKVSTNVFRISKEGNTRNNLANAGAFCERDGWIYFDNFTEKYEICKIKIDGTELAKLSDKTAVQISVVKGWLYIFHRLL